MTLTRGHKVLYFIIALVLSFLVWFTVNNDRSVTIRVDSVPIEFSNGDSVLADKGLVVESGLDTSVDLTLQMPRSMLYTLDPADIRLVADLGTVNSTGRQTVGYTIVYPSNISARYISVESPAVRTTSIVVGQLYSKEVEIRCKFVGTVAEGYAAGAVSFQPETLEVRGQQDEVIQVNYALVTLNIENASATIVKLRDYELYDYNDELIESDQVYATSDRIQVTMPVISAKEIPLIVNYIESTGVRLSSFDYGLDVDSIFLSGDTEDLAAIDSIVLDTILLEDLDLEQPLTRTYELAIPEGVENLSGVTSVTLTIANRDITTRTIEAVNFSHENFSTEREVEVDVVTSTLRVTLRGAAENLNALSPEDVRVVADLSGVTDASGAYTVPVNIYVPEDADLAVIGSYQAIVRITTEEAAT